MEVKIKKIILCLIALTLFLCVLTACGKKAEKTILGKWYNAQGDCLEILSDNTYSINQVSDKIYDIGLDSGKWEYLKEEEFFKFYTDSYKGDVIKIQLNKDKTGTYIEYSYYGVFYKNEFPPEVLAEIEKQKEEEYLSKTAVCPEFVGMKYEEIKKNDEYKENFNFTYDWQSNDEYDYGIVYEQSETVGERINKGTYITLCISMGRSTSRVPDVYGETESSAVSKLKINGFNTVISEIPSEDVEAGFVVKTVPERTEVVMDGAEITVYVSSGKSNKSVKIIDVVGLTKEEAEKKLTAGGFTFRTEEIQITDNDKYYPIGYVVKQSPKSDSQKVPVGTEIKIYVASAYKFDLDIDLPNDFEKNFNISLWGNGVRIKESGVIDSSAVSIYTFKDLLVNEEKAEFIVKISADGETKYNLCKLSINTKSKKVNQDNSIADYPKYK